MKGKKLLTILIISLIVLTRCGSSGNEDKSTSDSTDVSAEKALTAQDTVASRPEPQPVDPALLEAYEKSKVGWFETVADNERMIQGLKSAILAEKAEARQLRESKLNLLEQLNNKQKTKIALYKPEKEEDWERFRKIMDNDLKQINADLRELRKK